MISSYPCHAESSYSGDLPSLKNYQTADWFRDAKFGIYLHWGAYSVAERGEWYARKLYIEGEDDYKHHIKTYGHPSEFGYADFIPLWKAENFDPEGLLDPLLKPVQNILPLALFTMITLIYGTPYTMNGMLLIWVQKKT